MVGIHSTGNWAAALWSVLGVMLALHIVPCILVAGERDSEYRKVIRFEIDEDDGRYELQSEVEVYKTFLSRQSLEKKDYYVYESYYATVADIEAEYCDDDLDDDNIRFEYLEYRDVFLADTKVHTISFPSRLAIGDSIFYRYEQTFREIAFFPLLTVPNESFIKEFRVEFEHPEDVRVEFDFFFPRDEPDYIIERPEPDITLLRLHTIPEKPQLPLFPYNSFNAAVRVTLLKGDTVLNATNLTDFMNWYSGLFAFNAPFKAGESSLPDSLLQGAQTAEDTVRALYDFVRSSVRYLADERSMNAIVPRDPNLVFERRYGDCKDKAFLVAAMARNYGLSVHPVLVSTRPRPKFEGTHVSLYNHAINVFEHKGRPIFFDPTNKYGEFGTLPDGDIVQSAFILDLSDPRTAPIQPVGDRILVEVHIDAHVDSLGDARARIYLRGDYQAAARYALNELRSTERKNFLGGMLAQRFRKMSFDRVELLNDGREAMELRAQVDMTELLIASASRLYLPQIPFAALDAEALERADDMLPLYFRDLQRHSLRILLRAPGLTLEADSLNLDAAGRAWCRAQARINGPDFYEFQYDLGHIVKWMDGPLKKEYIAYCRRYLKNKKTMFVLERGK